MTEKQKAYLAEYRLKNKERLKKYREDHREQIAKTNHKWYMKNRERLLKKMREYARTKSKLAQANKQADQSK